MTSPLAQIVALAEQYQALTYLDEIHSAGVLWRTGLGYAERLGLLDKITIIQGRFRQVLRCGGRLYRRTRSVVEGSQRAPAFVFSTSSPAPVVAAALASFKYNLEHDTQQHLLAIVDHLKTGRRRHSAGVGRQPYPAAAGRRSAPPTTTLAPNHCSMSMIFTMQPIKCADARCPQAASGCG